MKQSDRRVINHIKNYIRVLEKRQRLYADTEYGAYPLTLMTITNNTITDLKATLKWYEDNVNGKN